MAKEDLVIVHNDWPTAVRWAERFKSEGREVTLVMVDNQVHPATGQGGDVDRIVDARNVAEAIAEIDRMVGVVEGAVMAVLIEPGIGATKNGKWGGEVFIDGLTEQREAGKVRTIGANDGNDYGTGLTMEIAADYQANALGRRFFETVNGFLEEIFAGAE